MLIMKQIEHYTESFQNFKESQSGVSLVSGLGAGAGASASEEVTDKSIKDTANTLDNSEDLSALWELLDIEDELAILRHLFETQKEVIEKMMVEYKHLDDYLKTVSTGLKQNHEVAVGWLEEARDQVNDYLKQVENLNESRESAQDSVSFEGPKDPSQFNL
jgi:hypothetical protein